MTFWIMYILFSLVGYSGLVASWVLPRWEYYPGKGSYLRPGCDLTYCMAFWWLLFCLATSVGCIFSCFWVLLAWNGWKKGVPLVWPLWFLKIRLPECPVLFKGREK